MKYFICVTLFFIFACESPNAIKEMKENEKSKTIQMKVITKPSINTKK